jgi:hypothetical protein
MDIEVIENGTANGGQFKSMDALRAAVEQHQDVLTVTMFDLREALGYGRLGQHVLATVSKALAGRGLGHVPRTLPGYQEHQVRIYKLGSPVAEIIEAAIEPGGEQRDEILREAANKEASLKLNQIRDLVCR